MGQVNWNNLYPNWNSFVQVKVELHEAFTCLIFFFFLGPKLIGPSRHSDANGRWQCIERAR